MEHYAYPCVGRGRGEVHFAFEATGHVWVAVRAFFERHAFRYHVVNPLANFRVRDLRQMGRDKRDLTTAEHQERDRSLGASRLRLIMTLALS